MGKNRGSDEAINQTKIPIFWATFCVGEEESSDGKSKFASDPDSDKSKKSYTRVHSVRRRRAKNIARDDDNKVEEKNAVTSTNFNYDMVDKSALIEEFPKEIREVKVECVQVKSSPPGDLISLKGLKDDKEEEEKDDDRKNNVMDVGISESERNKRLESLIARRRSRKMLSLQVRRTLMNMDRNDRPGQIAPIVIPKNNNAGFLSGPVSPGPGSAPSILVPMRNPFDLPYDPQEEKPDLTGDSFQQEFMSVNNNRDMMFCRHESFSLGAFNQNRDVFGFRHTPSSRGNHFGRERAPETETEQASHRMSESKSSFDRPNDDRIKQVIEVFENGVNSHSEDEQDTTSNEVETRSNRQQDLSNSSCSPSSSGSEEDVPVFKINREAILKSLSSMARRTDIPKEITENTLAIGDGSSYDTSSIRMKDQFYYGNKNMRRHTPSYSIASDLQVEVSEVSSPPLTIDENLSYQDEDMASYDGDMEKKITWDDEDLWASSSRLSQVDDDESRSTQMDENASQVEQQFATGEQNVSESNDMENLSTESIKSSSEDSEEMVKELSTHVNLGSIQCSEGEQTSAQGSISQTTQPLPLTPNEALEHVQTSLVSPKSVLLPTFSLDQGSLSSFDHDIDEEVQQSDAHNAQVSTPVSLQNSTVSAQHSTVSLPSFGGDVQVLQESSEPSRASTIEAHDTESVEKKLDENGTKQKETASGSSKMLGTHETLPEPPEELSKHQEMVNEDATHEVISDKSSSWPDHKEENSALHEDTGPENCSNKHTDHERQTNSTSSNGTKDELQNFDADEPHLPLPRQLEGDNDNSEAYMKNEHDRRAKQHVDSHLEDKLETNYSFDGETK